MMDDDVRLTGNGIHDVLVSLEQYYLILKKVHTLW